MSGGDIQIRDGGVTEPKLAVGNSPGINQVLSWDGTEMQWVVAGGAGDITSIITGSASGLSGGATSGDVTLAIADDGVTEARLSMGNDPATNQVITWNGTEMRWADPGGGGGGTGDITAVTTASNSGLQGGATTGAVALSFDFDSLPDITGANVFVGDLFVIRDANGGTNPYKSITQQHLATTFADNVTIQQSGGELRIRPLSVTAAHITDDTITEVKLAVGNAPAADQVLGWDGSSLQWVAAGGASGDDAFDWATEGNTDLIPDSKVAGTTIYHTDATQFVGSVLNITIAELGTSDLEVGDVVVFLVPLNLPTGNVLVRVNGGSIGTLIAQDGESVTGPSLTVGTHHILLRTGNATRLLGGDSYEWALEGNADLFPYQQDTRHPDSHGDGGHVCHANLYRHH